MRKTIIPLLVGIACSLTLSCKGPSEKAASRIKSVRKPIVTESFTFTDSSKYSTVTLSIDLPKGSSKTESAIREELKDLLSENLASYCQRFEESGFQLYSEDKNDIAALVQYYGKSISDLTNAVSKSDNDQRLKTISESSDLTQKEKDEMMKYIYSWEYDINLKIESQSDKYVVFSSSDYVYMGGAHGGMLGLGHLTFSKKTGQRVSPIVDPSSQEAIQGLLRHGLYEYFKYEDERITEENLTDYLFIEDETIPLPERDPFPSEDGLVFVYQQYEIAPYAAGMPTFTLSYDQIRQYLTPEAQSIL